MTRTTDGRSEERFMEEALDLARRGGGRVSPNPLVGAVVVNGHEIVGRGYHGAFGGPHAESVALEEAAGQARGATLYVSLEPCNHRGKTPPCTDAILRAGVSRVVCAVRDPNPHVAGGGLERLRREGVTVDLGLLEEKAKRLNEAYLKHLATGRPWVELKLAVSLDGRLAASGGGSRWISSERSRALVHRWRAGASAVLVGAGTVRADDPALTVRHTEGPNPARIIVSSRLDLPIESRVFRDREAETIVATTGSAPAGAAAAFSATGVGLWILPAGKDGRVSLASLFDRCGEEGMNRVLVEGGATLARALLSERLPDRLHLFIAPVILGSDGLSWTDALGMEDPSRAPRLESVEVSRLDDDVLVSGALPAERTAREG